MPQVLVHGLGASSLLAAWCPCRLSELYESPCGLKACGRLWDHMPEADDAASSPAVRAVAACSGAVAGHVLASCSTWVQLCAAPATPLHAQGG